jgi:hypothetical protein
MLRKTEDFNMGIESITKEQFLAAYNKYPPSGYIKFAFRYFSTNTLKEDMWVRRILQGVLGGLFLLGMLGTILSWSKLLIGIPTIAFTIILVILGIYLFTAAIICNNLRIRKIRKELGGITSAEFDVLVSKFMD